MNNHTGMKQIKMNTRINTHQEMIFEKAFDEFILFCKGNNYRKATIEHYTFSYNQIIKFIPYNTPISKINKETYDNFLLYLNELNLSDQTVLTYTRDFKRIVNYFIKNEYIPSFIMKLPKVDKKAIECYTNEEIRSLIRKPNTNKFTDYRNYVMVNFICAPS